MWKCKGQNAKTILRRENKAGGIQPSNNKTVCWLLPKRQEITSVGKDVKKRELLCTVGGNVNWCSHYRKRYEVPQKIKNGTTGLPWWRSGWEFACQCRGHGFEPWSGKIPRAAEQLSPWATITEPVRLEPALRNKRGRDNERPAHRDEEWPPLAATRESPRTETKTQHSHK